MESLNKLIEYIDEQIGIETSDSMSSTIEIVTKAPQLRKIGVKEKAKEFGLDPRVKLRVHYDRLEIDFTGVLDSYTFNVKCNNPRVTIEDILDDIKHDFLSKGIEADPQVKSREQRDGCAVFAVEITGTPFFLSVAKALIFEEARPRYSYLNEIIDQSEFKKGKVDNKPVEFTPIGAPESKVVDLINKASDLDLKKINGEGLYYREYQS